MNIFKINCDYLIFSPVQNLILRKIVADGWNHLVVRDENDEEVYRISVQNINGCAIWKKEKLFVRNPSPFKDFVSKDFSGKQMEELLKKEKWKNILICDIVLEENKLYHARPTEIIMPAGRMFVIMPKEESSLISCGEKWNKYLIA